MVSPDAAVGQDMTRIVLLVGALIVVAMVSPRMRVKTLVPLACVLLGLALAPGGVVHTVENAIGAAGGFLRSLPIGFLKGRR
ncbi:ABC transporter permease [Frankia sp. AiPa1]|uniref:ABC transporter permease n=1 Tax=Frankia sp. AiPa1 TaxID=573492 RepID=UPI00202B0866|nr:ABC transporter permease [Frankia sp. AiPa1]MCL9758792.1 ABC transporter permease [Frankia sp. AiPa1]